MALHRMPAGGSTPHPAGSLAPATAGWLMAGGVLGATALASSWLLPPPLVLLAMACALVGIGLVTAAALSSTGHRLGRDGTVGWDMASALVFFGIAAALLTDTGEVLTALAELGDSRAR